MTLTRLYTVEVQPRKLHDERYADILDALVALALKGSEKWSDGTIEEACEEGAEDATFRHIVTTLMAEATGMTLGTRQKLGYYKTVQYGLKSTRFDTFVVLDLLHSIDDRRYLIKYLATWPMHEIRPRSKIRYTSTFSV
ncbi:hypothetical protein DIPPA_03842 [Diplonema papillatum]|nr:hypothetical protein DIPPA_03842 [Diplonema papillatum]